MHYKHRGDVKVCLRAAKRLGFRQIANSGVFLNSDGCTFLLISAKIVMLYIFIRWSLLLGRKPTRLDNPSCLQPGRSY